jgi:hypothetical protein
MPNPPVQIGKFSFVGGELAPALWSRVDLQRYHIGARKLRNFLIHPTGGASNRPGLQFITKPKYANKKCRGVGFEFSTEQVYSIEFGEYYCRFYMNGGQIIAPESTAAWVTATVYYIGDFVKVSNVIYRSKTNHTSGAGNPTPPGNTTDWEASNIYEISTPYTEADLNTLKFTQSADVLYITHRNYYPRMLTRYSHISWRLELYPFEDGPFMSQNAIETLKITPSALTGTITLTASSALFNALHVGALFKLEHYIEGQAYTGAFVAIGVGTSLKCGGTWRIITHGTWTGKIKVEKSIDGGSTWTTIRVFTSAADYNPNTYSTEDEDKPFLVRVNCYSYTSGTINVDLTTDAFTQAGIVKIATYSSPTSVTATVLEEIGLATATADWSEGAWSDYRGYPVAATFYQDRLVFASTKHEPQTTWTTKTSNYINFGRSDPLVDSDGITVNLPSRKMNAIRHLVGLGEILAFTSSSEWSIGPGANASITPTSISQKLHGYRGCSEVTPVVIGSRVIFVQPKGSIVRDLAFDYASDSYTGDPLSLLSNHLFQNHQIIDMAYQAEPDSLLWAVRDDGILLSMTYLREQEVVAWTWHDTDGEFESVWTIPGETYDEVWFVIKRGSERFIERMVQRMVSTDPRDQFFVDCGLTYDVPKNITGITKATQAVVTAVGHGFVDGDLVDIAGVEGMTEVNNLRFKVSDKTADTFKLKDAEDNTYINSSAYTAYISGGKVRKAVTIISGLTHIEGKTVSVLADGSVIDNLVVASGAITLPVASSRVHVGLPYKAQLETLDIELNLATGTTQGKKLKVSGVTIRFLKSRGGWMGPDENNLDEVTQRTNEPMGSPISLQSGFYKQPITGDYSEGGRVFLEQRDPLPITILAIVPSTTVGG